MKKNLYTLALILILVLIIVLVSIFILRGSSSSNNNSNSDDPVVTAAPPRETDPPATEAPGTTEAPIVPREPPVTATPVATPAPTPKPTPKPTPTPIVADAEGTFYSDTGTGLNLKVDWKSYKGTDGTQKLKVDVSIVSYSIYTSSQYKSITLQIGDKTWGADCAGLSYDGKNQITTPAASFTVNAPPAGTKITVSWYYGGSYSGKAMEYITASGTVR